MSFGAEEEIAELEAMLREAKAKARATTTGKAATPDALPPLAATAVRVVITDGTRFASRDLDRSVLANAPRAILGGVLVDLTRRMDELPEQPA